MSEERSTVCEVCHKVRVTIGDSWCPLGGTLCDTTLSLLVIQVFKSKRAHSSHMKAHTKVLEPVNCNKCGKEFRHPSALRFHKYVLQSTATRYLVKLHLAFIVSIVSLSLDLFIAAYKSVITVASSNQ